MTITRLIAMLACGAMLVLGACTDTKKVPVRVPVGDPMADPMAETRAKQAEAALDELRASLAAAQAALGSSATTEQRLTLLTDVETDLETVQDNLQKQPASAARTAVSAALTAVGTAVTRVKAALAPTPASGGPVSFADMHTKLDQAQTAINDAQVKLKAAVAVAPATDTALRGLLAQAQAALTAAQVTLVPRLRSELLAQAEQAESDAAAQKARADTYDPRFTLNDAVVPSRLSRIGLPLHLTPKGSVEADAEGPAVTWKPRTDGVTITTEVTVVAGTTIAVGSTIAVTVKNDIQKEAVPWTGDKTLGLGAAGAVSTDEFQLRGMTMRGGPLGRQNLDGSDKGRLGQDGTYNPPVQGRAWMSGWKNWDAAYESSIRMNADGGGIALKMGGDGTVFFDFERIGALGGAAVQNQPEGVACVAASETCDDVIASDVEATFGTPVADPDGEASWHFKMRVPVNPDAPHTDPRADPLSNGDPNPAFDDLPSWALFRDDELRMLFRVPDEDGPYEDGDGKYRVERLRIRDSSGGLLTAAQANNVSLAGMLDVTNNPERADWKPLETRRAQRIDRGRPSEELGVYSTWLSNYAGLDTGDDADDPSDDTHRYLDYAAYGLFNFLDYSTRGMNYARVQAFHFGYDAFTDDGDDTAASATEPGGWGTAMVPITATFNGRTTGWMIRGALEEPGRIHDLIRLRGDVKLTATFDAGGGGHGTVEGSMNNFEFLRNNIWSTDVNFRHLLNDPAHADKAAVVLESGNIAANGSFSGVAKSTKTAGVGGDAHNYNDGTYGGAFYGPRVRGELEAAGYWNLPMHTSPQAGTGALIGSFGARSEPPPPPTE